MSQRKDLSKKQLAVIEDLFGGTFSELEVLERHKVSRSTFNEWQLDGNFAGEFDARIEALNRQSQAIIARS